MVIPHTYEYVKNFVESLGFILLSKTYKNNSSELIIMDKDGYIYITSYVKLSMKNINSNKGRFYKNNPYTIQNIKLWLKLNNKPLELINDKYINSKTKLIFKDIEGYYYEMNLDGLLMNNYTHSRFHQSNPYTIQNIKLWLELNNKTFKLLSLKFKKATEKLIWECLNCEKEFKTSWHDIYSGTNCTHCTTHSRIVTIYNCLATTNPELASEWHPTKNGDLTIYNVTYGKADYIWWKCSKCNHEWEASLNNRSRGRGCPKCSFQSKGENKIELLLKQRSINFIPQKTFPDCKNINVLEFDFYLPNYNANIEYQGRQHYESVDYFGGEKSFKLNQKRDQIKRDYCKNNNIKLIEIPYWDFDNIEQILQRELNLNDINLAI